MFRDKEFNYIIFDEAHMLKNMNTQRYDALIKFHVSITGRLVFEENFKKFWKNIRKIEKSWKNGGKFSNIIE